MTDVPEGKMICQMCHGEGEYVESHLVGDGQPGVETRIETETVDCHCENGLIDDPEYHREANN